MSKCSITECKTIAASRGLCNKHYLRLRKWGTTLPTYIHERKIGGRTKHGKFRTSEYTTWASMLQRCNNPNNQDYYLYGGRGISVCTAWQDFENFLKDMGEKPTPEHSIDREDNDGDYSPDNCRWATKKEQALNRRPRGSAL